ncbi:MAG: hypothetical protein AAFU49_00425, partial [Pseudomonadota bacterium]
LATDPPSPVRLHPNLGELYRSKVTEFAASLQNPAIRDEALGIVRSLVERVVIGQEASEMTLALEGEICALVGLGLPEAGVLGLDRSTAKVVAGACNQRYLFIEGTA